MREIGSAGDTNTPQPKSIVTSEPDTAAWHKDVGGVVEREPEPGSPSTAKANTPSGQTLPPGVNMGTTVASAATVRTRVLPSQTGQTSGSNDGSPEEAKDGAVAAGRLLNQRNSYFNARILFRTDSGYNPENARAEAFAATLFDYERNGDKKNIELLLKTLGPAQAAKLFSEAGNLQYQPVNKDSTAFDQKPVLANALLTPGVLGDGTKPGTLAYSLLQQAMQSGSGALSIAGILNASGTNPQTEALKQQMLAGILVDGKALGKPSFDQDSYATAARALINNDPALLSKYSGGIGVQKTFASNGVPVPDADGKFLRGQIRSIDANLYGLDNKGEPKGPGNPVTGSISPNTMSEIQRYLDGQDTKGEPSSQLLANMMNVLGPDRTYAVLSQLPQTEMIQGWKELDFEGSLKTLTENGQFTADDAKALADAQVKFATSETGSGVNATPNAVGSVGRIIASLPPSPNATAVKTAYAEECISNVQQLSQQIAGGKYSPQALRTLNSLADNAAKVISNSPIDVKVDLFSKLHATATQFAKMGKGNEADALNAYAAGLLSSGSPGDQSKIAATLRGLGGVGADGAIAPASPLAQFLRSALNGQAEFGFAGLSDLAPNGTMPNPVTHLLDGIAASGDKKLMAGTLDVAMQWTINNPAQAQVLAAQDNRDGSPGYREALTHMLDLSFNELVALAPGDPSAKLVKSMQDQPLADLQALSVVAMGPPYDSKVAGDFANVIGKHSVEFAAYATGAKDPVLDRLFAGIGDRADATQRHASALIFGQTMDAFAEGLNQEEASAKKLATSADTAAAINELQSRIVTDYLRGAGTTLLLASSFVPGAGIAIGGLKLTGNAVSVAGRFFLGTGSWGTLFLDQGQLGDTVTEGQAIQAVSQGLKAADLTPSQGMRQLYDGWVTKVSQLPGKGNEGDENFETLESLYTGASYAAAPMIKTAFNDFYDRYDPMGYTRDQTGQNPPVA